MFIYKGEKKENGGLLGVFEGRYFYRLKGLLMWETISSLGRRRVTSYG